MPIGLKRATSGRSDSLPGPENHKKRPEIRKEEASLPEIIPNHSFFSNLLVVRVAMAQH